MDTERTLSDVAKKDFHPPRQLSSPNVDANNPSPNVAHNGRILVRFYPGSLMQCTINKCNTTYTAINNVKFCTIAEFDNQCSYIRELKMRSYVTRESFFSI